MDNSIAICVIGAGIIGRTHIETLSKTKAFHLVGLVDPAPSAQQLARDLGVKCWPDVAGMITDGGVRAAIVATPNETHLPVSSQLLDAGIAVLLEKPVAESLDSALALIAKAESAGVPLLVGHHRRHNPLIRRCKELIAAGQIGDLVMATVTCSLAKPDSYYDTPWRRSVGAGGPLLINLVHEIDMLRHFFGEISQVQALTSHRQRGFEVEDGAAVSLAFVDGGLATLCISDAATGPWAWDLSAGENKGRFPAHPVSAHLYAGTKGGISLPDLTLWQAQGSPDWTTPLLPQNLRPDNGDPYAAQLDHFADLIRHGGAPLVSARDATANLIVLDAIRASATSGTRIEVDLSPLNADSGTTFRNGTSP